MLILSVKSTPILRNFSSNLLVSLGRIFLDNTKIGMINICYESPWIVSQFNDDYRLYVKKHP